MCLLGLQSHLPRMDHPYADLFAHNTQIYRLNFGEELLSVLGSLNQTIVLLLIVQ